MYHGMYSSEGLIALILLRVKVVAQIYSLNLVSAHACDMMGRSSYDNLGTLKQAQKISHESGRLETEDHSILFLWHRLRSAIPILGRLSPVAPWVIQRPLLAEALHVQS